MPSRPECAIRHRDTRGALKPGTKAAGQLRLSVSRHVGIDRSKTSDDRRPQPCFFPNVPAQKKQASCLLQERQMDACYRGPGITVRGGFAGSMWLRWQAPSCVRFSPCESNSVSTTTDSPTLAVLGNRDGHRRLRRDYRPPCGRAGGPAARLAPRQLSNIGVSSTAKLRPGRGTRSSFLRDNQQNNAEYLAALSSRRERNN